jgi:phosphonoacetaldehyde hydrolase
VVKVDDTGVGIEEGLAAGTWTVGVAVSGNAVGLGLPDWRGLNPAQQEVLRERAGLQLRAAGAHFVVDSVADLLPVVEEISRRVAAGERP